MRGDWYLRKYCVIMIFMLMGYNGFQLWSKGLLLIIMKNIDNSCILLMFGINVCRYGIYIKLMVNFWIMYFIIFFGVWFFVLVVFFLRDLFWFFWFLGLWCVCVFWVFWDLVVLGVGFLVFLVWVFLLFLYFFVSLFYIIGMLLCCYV